MLFLILVFIIVGILGFLSITEYRPAEREALAVVGSTANTIAPGESLTVMTWNIRYGVLDENGDFVSSAERVQLPIPFSWPARMANLKRCALITRLPVEGCEQELVLFNLYLEAFDHGEGKSAQTEMLAEMMAAERKKGNYVIAGGDFNQVFSTANNDAYPVQPGKWTPGRLEADRFPGIWQFLMDNTTPSCRSLDRPYAGADRDTFQYYLIDGFIVSDNITVESLAAKDLGFSVSDHNPVAMTIKLR